MLYKIKTDYLNSRFYISFCLIFSCTKCFYLLSVHPKMKRVIRKTLKQEFFIESDNSFVFGIHQKQGPRKFIGARTAQDIHNHEAANMLALDA